MDFVDENELDGTKRRQVPPSPLGQKSFSGISPPMEHHQNEPKRIEDSGLSSSVESNIASNNGQYNKGQEGNIGRDNFN
jgi:hypothetical protein